MAGEIVPSQALPTVKFATNSRPSQNVPWDPPGSGQRAKRAGHCQAGLMDHFARGQN